MELNRGPRISSLQKPYEEIRDAAVLYKGQTFEGTTHGHALSALLVHLKTSDPELYAKVGGDEYQLVDELEKLDKGTFDFEGFVTSTGRYVKRAEATEIGRNARQLNKPKEKGSDLYSEDLKG